jgi:uncharacterized membrane protein
MLTGNSTGAIQEEKKEVIVESIENKDEVKEDKKEENNNNEVISNKKEVSDGLTLSEKIVEQPQPESKVVEGKEKKIETEVKEAPSKKTNLEVKEQNVFEKQTCNIKNTTYEQDIKNIPDAFIFGSVFILMLIGYYLVK